MTQAIAAPLSGGVAVHEDGRYVRVVKPSGQCKCCDPEWQQVVLELFLREFVSDAIHPKGAKALTPEIRSLGLDVSATAVRNHRAKHCEFGQGLPPHLSVVDKDPRQRELEFRAEVDVVLGAEHVVDARGAHITFLEDVVGVAQARVRHFPEHVTLEQGLRAAAELTKAKQNAERDTLLQLLALSAGRTGGNIGQGREAAIGRRMLPVLEAAADGAG